MINKFGVIGGVVVILVAVLVVWAQYRRPGIVIEKGPLAYFVDEDTGEESVQLASEVPPIGNNVGRACVVRMYKVSFDGGATLQPLYLVKYTEEVQFELQKMKSGDPRWQEVASAGEMVRRPGKGQRWVAGTSAEGAAIKELPMGAEGKRAEVVEPK